MYKVAVLGDRDSIYGFAALGLDVYPVSNAEEGAKTLRRLSEQSYAVIYVTEALCSQIPDELERYENTVMPAIIPIPGIRGNTGMGISMVKRSVEKAVGSDIIFGND